MAVCRTDGVFLHVTDAYCDLVGKRQDELVGQRADEAGLAVSTERMRWIIERLPDSGRGFAYRRTFDTPSGPRLVESHLHRMDEDLIVSTLLEVTAEDPEQDADAVLGSFLNAIPLGFIVYDRELRIVRVNRTVEQIGRVRPEHLGQRITDAFPRVDPSVLEAIQSVLDGGAEIVNQQLTRPDDGHEFLMHFFPIRDARGVSQVGCLFSDVTALNQAQRLIFAQRLPIQELSTPILELDEGLLVLPLTGMVDSERAMEITERLLEAIRDLRGRMVVIDVTGVPVVDSAVANHLANTIQAARLMGATAIITGMAPESAMALARLGIDPGRVNAAGNLRDAVTDLRAHTSDGNLPAPSHVSEPAGRG